jgi:hypothetical protein
MKNGLTIVTGPSIKWRTTMEQFIGLDVSLKDTCISVREGGRHCRRDPSLRRQQPRFLPLYDDAIVDREDVFEMLLDEAPIKRPPPKQAFACYDT